jgi:hypothetical protein
MSPTVLCDPPAPVVPAGSVWAAGRKSQPEAATQMRLARTQAGDGSKNPVAQKCESDVTEGAGAQTFQHCHAIHIGL